MCPSSGETTVFMRHLLLVILSGWLSGMQEHVLLHTRQSSTGETTVFMRHLLLVVLCGWLSGMHEHMLLHTRQSSTQNNNTKCRINTIVSPHDGHIFARNMERLITILRINCAPSWLYLQDYTGLYYQQNIFSTCCIRSSAKYCIVYVLTTLTFCWYKHHPTTHHSSLPSANTVFITLNL